MKTYDPREDNRFATKYPLLNPTRGWGPWIKVNFYFLALILVCYAIYLVKQGGSVPVMRAIFGL